jgi:uncharacterized protein YcaQ
VTRRLSLRTARRLAITAQRLAATPWGADGTRPRRATAPDIMAVARDLGCVQIDPTATIAKTQFLVLWSRLGAYDTALFRRLTEEQHLLFEYWAHAASYCLAEDFPIHSWYMRSCLEGSSAWATRVRGWLERNGEVAAEILAQLDHHGPLRSRDFAGTAVGMWEPGGWNDGRDVSRVLELLSVRGDALVARRDGNQKYWDLGERCLPTSVDRTELPTAEVVRRSARRALRALGVATQTQIGQHFTRGRYPGLRDELAALVASGEIVEVTVEDTPARDRWYVDGDSLDLVDRIEAGDWRGRTTLLSPFDNLICDRARTLLLWDFDFKLEIYTPPAQRRWGFYVLPILHGDRLVGRIEPVLDRRTATLRVAAPQWENGVRPTAALVRGIDRALADLAAFVGATDVARAG